MHDIIVGVDAGGSHTVAAVARGEKLLRTAAGDAANPQLRGLDRSIDAIASTINAALAGKRPATHDGDFQVTRDGNSQAACDGESQAVFDRKSLAAIAVGVAGAGREETKSAVLAELAVRFPGARIAVTDDAHIALRGAIPAGDGIVLIAGTGSIAYAEIDGHRFRAGGYGYAIGDAGSGYALGAAALRLLLQSYEGRVPHDALCAAIAAHLGVETARDTLAAIYESEVPIAAVAACAPLVLDLANSGERSASKIVQSAALDLFSLARSLHDLTHAPHPIILSGAPVGRGVEGRDLPIALAGGLLRANSLLTYLLETRIANELPHLRVVKGGEPYLGALAAARALLA